MAGPEQGEHPASERIQSLFNFVRVGHQTFACFAGSQRAHIRDQLLLR